MISKMAILKIHDSAPPKKTKKKKYTPDIHTSNT